MVRWLVLWLVLPFLRADVSGVVRDAQDQPIAGVLVRVQTTAEPVVTTDGQGAFTLPVTGTGLVTLGFAKPYDLQDAVQYLTRTVTVNNGTTSLEGTLEAIPKAINAGYFPIRAASPNGCGDCHDLQMGEWSLSRHAGTAENTWVQDVFAAYSADHPGETGFCATCHAPNADVAAPGTFFLDELDMIDDFFDRASAKEGVNCSACHQMDHVNEFVDGLHLVGNATMRFPADGIAGTHEYVWGPLADVDYAFMKAVYQPQFGESRFCASCHEYSNPKTGVPAQTTYSEWLASTYGDPEHPDYRTCQDCHMPRSDESGRLCDPPTGFGNGPDRPAGSHASHQIEATTAQGLRDAVDVAVAVGGKDGHLSVQVSVTNGAAGHAMPTGISLRNMILRVSAEGDGGAILAQVSGSVVPFYGSDDDGLDDDGDWAGLPGKGYAKVLADENGVMPVLFIEAHEVAEDTRLAAGTTDVTAYGFSLATSADPCALDAERVRVILTWRRAWRALVENMGWTTDNRGNPWEITLFDEIVPVDPGLVAAGIWQGVTVPPAWDRDGDGRLTVLDVMAVTACSKTD